MEVCWGRWGGVMETDIWHWNSAAISHHLLDTNSKMIFVFLSLIIATNEFNGRKRIVEELISPQTVKEISTRSALPCSRDSPPSPVPSRMKPGQALPAYSCKTCLLYCIYTSTPRSSNIQLSFCLLTVCSIYKLKCITKPQRTVSLFTLLIM
jgi:hypothetical protein